MMDFTKKRVFLCFPLYVSLLRLHQLCFPVQEEIVSGHHSDVELVSLTWRFSKEGMPNPAGSTGCPGPLEGPGPGISTSACWGSWESDLTLSTSSLFQGIGHKDRYQSPSNSPPPLPFCSLLLLFSNLSMGFVLWFISFSFYLAVCKVGTQPQSTSHFPGVIFIIYRDKLELLYHVGVPFLQMIILVILALTI